MEKQEYEGNEEGSKKRGKVSREKRRKHEEKRWN